MRLIIFTLVVIFVSFLMSCSESKKDLVKESLSCEYRATVYKDTLLRGWSTKYWDIEIKNNKGQLSYQDNGRFLNCFSLSISVEFIDSNVFLVKLDSSKSFTTTVSMRKNDVIFKGERHKNYIEILSVLKYKKFFHQKKLIDGVILSGVEE